MDASGYILASLDAGYHAGMTEICISSSVGERKLMNHFVVKSARHFFAFTL